MDSNDKKTLYDDKTDFKQKRTNVLILSVCVINPVELLREITQGTRLYLNILYLASSSLVLRYLDYQGRNKSIC